MTDQLAAQQMHEAADILRQFALAAENGSTAALHPGIVVLFADWLGCLAVTGHEAGDKCGWCGGNHAVSIARAITNLVSPAAAVTP